MRTEQEIRDALERILSLKAGRNECYPSSLSRMLDGVHCCLEWLVGGQPAGLVAKVLSGDSETMKMMKGYGV